VIVALAAGGIYWRSRQSQKLTEKDTLVLADFANTTGEAVFDDTLKQALAIQLEQSPFLNVLPERRASATLAMMGRPPHERITRDMAREICQRTASKALLIGSIAALAVTMLSRCKPSTVRAATRLLPRNRRPTAANTSCTRWARPETRFGKSWASLWRPWANSTSRSKRGLRVRWKHCKPSPRP